MRRILVYNRLDAPLFELAEADVFACTRIEEVGGEHSLTITTTRVLEKGWRILTVDGRGRWREHVVHGTDALHGTGGRPVGTYYCVWSLLHDLMGTRVSKMPGVQSPVAAGVALDAALSGTARWQVGTVTRTASAGASMYDMSGWDAVGVLVETWGGELESDIEVGATGVVRRRASLYEKQGNQAATRRFDFGADLKSVRRRLPDGPLYCRITPRGKGEKTEGGSYGRKVTIADANGGKDYLENPSMVDLAKLPDGSGGWEYPTVEVENPDCETPADLLAWARTVVDEYTVPKITYEVDVLQLAAEGVDAHGVSLGDAVQVVDGKFDDLRIEGRAVRIETNELDEDDVRLTLGHLSGGLAGLLGGLSSGVSALRSAVYAMNGGTLSTADYLSRLLDRLNAEINATGGYTYITQGQGLRTYDKTVSDPLVGAEAGSVVELKGGNIRIANSRTASGDWEWKTVLQSGHIAAGLITAANITAGFIGSPSGNYWNLDTGEFQMAAIAATVDGKPIATEEYVDDYAEKAITEVDVEYRLSDSETALTGNYEWQTTAPAWVDGKYMWTRTKTVTDAGTAYSDPTCISGARGQTGAAGTDGRDGASITVSKIEWAPGASGTSAPASGWQASVPSVAQGEWLWCRVEYSDGSTALTPSYQGTDGEDGVSVSVRSVTKSNGVTTVKLVDSEGHQNTLTINDGQDGDSGTPGSNGYVHIAWATSADGSTGFSTSSSANKTYIGVYSDHTQADSTDYRSYSWSKIKGDDGADGTGVSSIEEQYYLSSSNTTQTGGSWSTSQPTWSSGKYIWTRSKVTWSDSSVTYTNPILAKAINKANETASSASTAVTNLNTELNQEGIFNRLTNNGQTQGIYLSGGKVYINGTYIKSGAIDASYITAGSLIVKSGSTTIFSANITAGTVTLGGFTVAGSKLYSKKTSLTDNTYGVYIGTDGIAVGSSSAYTALAGGYLRGGNASDITGYVGFNNYWQPTGVYGTRLAGRGCVAILTNGGFGVGSYYAFGTTATISSGESGTMKYIEKIQDNGDGSITWWTSSVTFKKGLMNTSL